MLRIRFGTTEDTIIDVDEYFDYDYEDEWFEDPIVKKIVQDIDNTEVKSVNLVISPALGQITIKEISGGAKAVILMLKEDEEIWATACGDNCAKWIAEIAKMKDITISLEHFLSFPDNHFPFIDAETGELYDDYFDQIIKRGF